MRRRYCSTTKGLSTQGNQHLGLLRRHTLVSDPFSELNVFWACTKSQEVPFDIKRGIFLLKEVLHGFDLLLGYFDAGVRGMRIRVKAWGAGGMQRRGGYMRRRRSRSVVIIIIVVVIIIVLVRTTAELATGSPRDGHVSKKVPDRE